MSKSLYKVTCRGMQGSLCRSVAHGVAFVVADNPHNAYSAVRKYLDERGLGLRSDRTLERVELIAEDGDYPECGTRLFLS